MNHATIDRFSRLCDRVSLPAGESCQIWNLLEDRYREPHRHYHNLRHITSMLEHLDRLHPGGDAVELSIRSEYSHVPDREFVAGRQAVLTRFLAGRIYFTVGFGEFEAAARRNIAMELECLG